MGKRELVLIVAFLVLGIAVYQFTAPPPPPGSEGFSIGGLIRNVRRGVHGPREMATADSSQTAVVPATVNELRLSISRTSDVTITGEDRTDIAASLHVTGHGFDPSEAAAVAHGPRVKIETSADTITVSLETTGVPQGSQARLPPMISLTLAVPKRLTIRAEPHIGHFFVTNVAALEASSSRGETRISSLSGSLRLTHTGGTLEISSVGSLKLTARSSRGTVQNVRGPATIDGTGSELTLTGIAGPIEFEGQKADLTLEAGTELKPPLHVNMTGGLLRVRGLRVETRIDGRNTDISVALDAAAPVTIYNVGGIAVTAPPGGYTLDATATEGRVTVEDRSVPATDGPDSHAEAQVRGGGPLLMLRATRGPIEVRKPEGK
jgi:hypothetical protein